MRKKPFTYQVHYENSSRLQKLYNMYIKKSIVDKILDILVFCAIAATITSAIFDLILGIDTVILLWINGFSLLILFIFIIELVREYAKSKTKRQFLKKHWIDLILVTFLSLFYLISILGIIFFNGLLSLRNYFQDAKYTRVFFQLFKR